MKSIEDTPQEYTDEKNHNECYMENIICDDSEYCEEVKTELDHKFGQMNMENE